MKLTIKIHKYNEDKSINETEDIMDIHKQKQNPEKITVDIPRQYYMDIPKQDSMEIPQKQIQKKVIPQKQIQKQIQNNIVPKKQIQKQIQNNITPQKQIQKQIQNNITPQKQIRRKRQYEYPKSVKKFLGKEESGFLGFIKNIF